MNIAGKITTGVAVVVLGGLVALAVPAFASIGQAAHDAAKGVGNIAATLNPSADSTAASTAEPTPEPTPTDPLQAAAWEIGCDDFAAVGGYAGAARPSARPDRGPITHASGPVIFNADGEVETYTVQPGDAGTSIGERFCVDYVTLLVANDVWPTLQPGDVLVINP